MPSQYYATFASWFELDALREFVDPNYALTLRPRLERVTAARVASSEELRVKCASLQPRN